MILQRATTKHTLPILTALLLAPLATLHAAQKHPGQGTLYETIKYDPASPEKMKWWEDAKFGLFVHWGVYSVPGGIWSKDNTFKSRFDGNTNNWVEVKPTFRTSRSHFLGIGRPFASGSLVFGNDSMLLSSLLVYDGRL